MNIDEKRQRGRPQELYDYSIFRSLKAETRQYVVLFIIYVFIYDANTLLNASNCVGQAGCFAVNVMLRL